MRTFKSMLCLAALLTAGLLFADSVKDAEKKAIKAEIKAERAEAKAKAKLVKAEEKVEKAEAKAEMKAEKAAKTVKVESKAAKPEVKPVVETKAVKTERKAGKAPLVIVVGDPDVTVETKIEMEPVANPKAKPAEKPEAKLAAKCSKADAKCGLPPTLACLKKCYPRLKHNEQASAADEVFDYYTNPVNGHLYMVYVWKEPATVYNCSFAKGNKLHDGSEIMAIKPDGRSKGKVKMAQAAQVVAVRSDLKSSSTLHEGDVIGEFMPTLVYHDSLPEGSKPEALPGWGACFKGLWESTGICDIINQTSADFANTWILGLGRVIMMLVALVLIYLAIVKEFEPLLLLPIGFGALLANIPLAGISAPGGLQYLIFEVGINSGVFPLLIFMGVGAMTDFGPMIATPKTALLGGAAQLGIFTALLGALALNVVPGIEFNIKDAASIGIIGGADGPTSIFLTSRLSPSLLGAIAVAAYSYMALVPIIQPPIMKALTTEAEKKIRMGQLRPVSKIEKICFPLLITFLCAFLLPDAAPLMGMLMFGNLMRECGVVERLNDTAQNALINIVTIFLGIAVGSKLSAEQFLSAQTLGILVLGCLAFCIGTAGGVLMAKLMNLVSKDKINPLIGAAGVSAVPMAARVVNKVGLSYDSQNFLLMQAMGPNVSGVIGSAVAAGVLLKLCGGL